jgi:hypothetical protein
MSAIPFELRSLDATEAGELLGYTARTVREELACKPDFPKRVDSDGRPRWIAGELMAWREANRACRRGSRRRSGSKSATSASHGAR